MTSTLIGLYGVSQVFSELDNFRKPQNTEICADIGRIFPPFKKILSMWKIIFSSPGIGTLIGAIPGTGASTAVFMSRNAASGICGRSKGKPDMSLVYPIFITRLISNIFMGVFQLAGVRFYPRILLISQRVLMPVF